MALSEFALINRYFTDAQANSNKNSDGVTLGIGDDAALLRIRDGYEIAVSTDTLNSGVHFPVTTGARDIACKCVAVNVSDLAAMGAQPRFATLAISLPQIDENWLREFSQSLAEQLDHYRVTLVGGDTTRGPLSINMTLMGEVRSAQALRRSQAQPGDLICVTGTLGDAAYGLTLALSRTTPQSNLNHSVENEVDRDYFLQRLNRPQARVEIGLLLVGHARCAIDVSDGFAQDLEHILHASNVGAHISAEKIPLSPALVKHCGSEQALHYALTGGDDYELIFTVSPGQWPVLQAQLNNCAIAVNVVGVIEQGKQLRIDYQGKPYLQSVAGYDHFDNAKA